MIRIIAACAGCLFLIWIASCGMSHWKDWYSVAHPPRVEIGNRRIVFYGTPEYDAVVIDLKYTATQARDKSIQWQKRNSGSIPGRHRMIVNDEYVFSDLCKSGVSLSGYYVDGNTGKVRRVFDDFIPTGQAEELGYTERQLYLATNASLRERKLNEARKVQIFIRAHLGLTMADFGADLDREFELRRA